MNDRRQERGDGDTYGNRRLARRLPPDVIPPTRAISTTGHDAANAYGNRRRAIGQNATVSEGKQERDRTVTAFNGNGVTVYFDRARCTQYGECVNALPDVFDRGSKPWIQPEDASPEDIATAVRKCPTGALHYEIADGPAEEPESPTRVDPQTDGPLMVRGDLRITLADGEISETRATLCRCGRSGNKPFCDFTCSKTGWRSDWHPPED